MSPAAPPSLRLVYQRDGRRAALDVSTPQLELGRQETCDVVLPGADVSRQHARIALEQGRWWIADLKSSNGTRVNGRAVTRQELRDGDSIRIGSHEVVCELAQTLQLEVPDDALSVAEKSLDVQDLNAVLAGVLPGAEPDLAERDMTLVQTRARPIPALRVDEDAHDVRWVLRMLHDATRALMEHEELDPTLEQVVDLVFQHLPAERCFVLLVEAGEERLAPRIQRTRPGHPRGTLRISRNIVDLALESRKSVLVRDARTDERLESAESIVSLAICSAMCAPLVHEGRVGGLIYVDRSSDLQVFSGTHLAVLSILASISAAAVDRARLRESLQREQKSRERLSRYHAPSVVERILRSGDRDEGQMDAEERVVTVLFADLSGFTRMAEHMTPREVTSMLNELFGILTEEVFLESGTLDKFIGDALMAFFGAPIPQPDHALRAVRAARAMQARLGEFNAGRASTEQLAMRIGINTGPVIVGDVGALQRRDYTVIGDTVNVASRLESSVAVPGQVVIGAGTFEAVREQFECRALEPILLKGKALPFQPYLVV